MAMTGYNPSYCIILSADINDEVGRGAVLLSGNDDPVYAYEERVYREDGVWHGGGSSNGPSMGTVWTDDYPDGLCDATFWVDVDPEADGVRVTVADSVRELPSAYGLAVCFVAGVPEDDVVRHRPIVLSYRVRGQWVE